ncbi:MAG: ubiquinone/menaquinone biosynthesis methyltransferase [Desulfobacterales bacterium]
MVKAAEKGRTVRAMFDRIAHRYDLLNGLMTFGRDRYWRRTVVRLAGLSMGGRLLDVATGTGMIGIEALRDLPGLDVTACDFSLEMMQEGRRRPESRHLKWCCTDALRLPFPEGAFDAVTSGFLIRNVADPLAAFREQVRVVRPCGRVVCLDTAPPARTWYRPLVDFQLKRVIPLLGTWLSGDAHAYRYLPDSTLAFKSPRELAAIMEKAGLIDVTFRTFMLGTIVILAGARPGNPVKSEAR